ncbi:MAG: RNA polymerase sigma factor [Verrucomicrobiota bacterium]
MPPDSVAALYDAHAPALYRFILSLCGSEADTLDLLQDLFVRVVRQRRETLEDPQAFLFRAARNLFLDQLRRRAHRRRVLDDYEGEMKSLASHFPESAVPGLPGPETALAVARALACLPEEQRAVVHLKIWENLTFARIAEILDIPANTAASRYRYAMDRLRRTLTPEIPGHAR